VGITSQIKWEQEMGAGVKIKSITGAHFDQEDTLVLIFVIFSIRCHVFWGSIWNGRWSGFSGSVGVFFLENKVCHWGTARSVNHKKSGGIGFSGATKFSQYVEEYLLLPLKQRSEAWWKKKGGSFLEGGGGCHKHTQMGLLGRKATIS